MNSKVTFSSNSLSKELRAIRNALPFILPGFILVCLFVLYPTVKNIVISLSDYSLTHDKITKIVGLKNYQELISGDLGRFWYAYRNNILYAIVTTPVVIFLGVVFATMINSVTKGKVFFRTVYYIPVITSWVIVALVFTYLFNVSNRGLVNYTLVEKLHLIKNPVVWLKEEWPGNTVIWLLGIWKNMGYNVIIFLAGLQSIPKEQYEAASIEGSSSINSFFKITMPCLKPVTYFLAIQSIIGSFNVFLQVLILTGGDPMGRTSVLQYLLYEKTFKLLLVGQGAAVGVITAISIFIISIGLKKFFKSE